MTGAIRPLLLASFVLFFAGTALLAVAQKERTPKTGPGAELRPEYVQYFAALQENQAEGYYEGYYMIFVGVIEDVSSPPLTCVSAANQWVTFRVQRVLLGAWTKPTIKIGYPSCSPGLPSPPFTRGAKWIVFRPGLYFANYFTDMRYGMFAPTEANIAVVLKATEHGAGLRREFVQRFLARGKQSGVLFVGRIIDPGKPPRACKEAVAQSVHFKVDEPLWGKVPKNTIRIGYINCTMQQLPSPPFTKELPWIVFAESEGNSFHAYTDVAQPELRYALFPATDYNVHLVNDLLGRGGEGTESCNARRATRLAPKAACLGQSSAQ